MDLGPVDEQLGPCDGTPRARAGDLRDGQGAAGDGLDEREADVAAGEGACGDLPQEGARVALREDPVEHAAMVSRRVRVAGVVLHFRGNMSFQLDMDPAIAGWDLFTKVMHAKAPPALAPGAMVQLGLIGLIYTLGHPAIGPAGDAPDRPSRTGA